jgi:beta-N-acetylglucosaminidase
MWNDEIVEETRKTRDEYAAKFNHDLTAIYKDLREQQNRAEHKIANLPPKRPVLLPQTKAS